MRQQMQKDPGFKQHSVQMRTQGFLKKVDSLFRSETFTILSSTTYLALRQIN